MYDSNYSKMIKKILRLSASLGKIEYKIGDNMIGFYKNQAMFGKLEDDVLYLLNSSNGFDRIEMGYCSKMKLLQKKRKMHITL